MEPPLFDSGKAPSNVYQASFRRLNAPILNAHGRTALRLLAANEAKSKGEKKGLLTR